MELFRIDSNFFYRLVGIKCERETLEYVLREMEKVLEEELPPQPLSAPVSIIAARSMEMLFFIISSPFTFVFVFCYKIILRKFCKMQKREFVKFK